LLFRCKTSGKKDQKALPKVDATYSQGINVSGSSNAVIFNLQGGISIDTKGNVAIQGIGGSIAAPVYGVPIAS
jgi:hypothetical protein